MGLFFPTENFWKPEQPNVLETSTKGNCYATETF